MDNAQSFRLKRDGLHCTLRDPKPHFSGSQKILPTKNFQLTQEQQEHGGEQTQLLKHAFRQIPACEFVILLRNSSRELAREAEVCLAGGNYPEAVRLTHTLEKWATNFSGGVSIFALLTQLQSLLASAIKNIDTYSTRFLDPLQSHAGSDQQSALEMAMQIARDSETFSRYCPNSLTYLAKSALIQADINFESCTPQLQASAQLDRESLLRSAEKKYQQAIEMCQKAALEPEQDRAFFEDLKLTKVLATYKLSICQSLRQDPKALSRVQNALEQAERLFGKSHALTKKIKNKADSLKLKTQTILLSEGKTSRERQFLSVLRETNLVYQGQYRPSINTMQRSPSTRHQSPSKPKQGPGQKAHQILKYKQNYKYWIRILMNNTYELGIEMYKHINSQYGTLRQLLGKTVMGVTGPKQVERLLDDKSFPWLRFDPSSSPALAVETEKLDDDIRSYHMSPHRTKKLSVAEMNSSNEGSPSFVKIVKKKRSYRESRESKSILQELSREQIFKLQGNIDDLDDSSLEESLKDLPKRMMSTNMTERST